MTGILTYPFIIAIDMTYVTDYIISHEIGHLLV